MRSKIEERELSSAEEERRLNDFARKRRGRPGWYVEGVR